MKPKLPFILLFILWNTCSAQTSKHDKQLSRVFSKYVAEAGEDRVEKVGLFDKALLNCLKDPRSLTDSFPMLGREIRIISSADKKLRFYCWDDRTGGTWQRVMAYGQHLNRWGSSTVFSLDQDTSGYGEVFVSRIDDFISAGMQHYLVAGWGTHGGGKQFVMLKVYTLSNGLLSERRAFPDSSRTFVLQYSRSDTLGLRFDPKEKELSYREFIYNDPYDTYDPSGKRISLVWRQGMFVKKEE